MINTFNDHIDSSTRMKNFGARKTSSLKLLIAGILVGFVCYMGV